MSNTDNESWPTILDYDFVFAYKCQGETVAEIEGIAHILPTYGGKDIEGFWADSIDLCVLPAGIVALPKEDPLFAEIEEFLVTFYEDDILGQLGDQRQWEE